MSLVTPGANRMEADKRRFFWQALRSGRRRATRPLVLEIAGRTLRFATPEDFSFSVRCRISVPARRFEASLGRLAGERRREAEDIRKMEIRLAALLDSSAGHCGAAVRKLHRRTFSNDHGWREILEQLGALGNAYDEYQREALASYLQYLGARRETLHLIDAITHRRLEIEQGTADALVPGPATKHTVIGDVMQAEEARGLFHPDPGLAAGAATRARLGRGRTMGNPVE